MAKAMTPLAWKSQLTKTTVDRKALLQGHDKMYCTWNDAIERKNTDKPPSKSTNLTNLNKWLSHFIPSAFNPSLIKKLHCLLDCLCAYFLRLSNKKINSHEAYLTNSALMSESSSSGTSNLLVSVKEISVFEWCDITCSSSTSDVSPNNKYVFFLSIVTSKCDPLLRTACEN